MGENGVKMRRFRLQFHLSTALVLMIAAGVVVWGNMQADRRIVVSDWKEINAQWYCLFQNARIERGWPWPFLIYTGRTYPRVYKGVYDPSEKAMALDDVADKLAPSDFSGSWSARALAANAGVAAGILLLIAVACEVWITWRRKTAARTERDAT